MDDNFVGNVLGGAIALAIIDRGLPPGRRRKRKQIRIKRLSER